MFKIGQRVYIIPIDEYGTITKIRYDDVGIAIYHVDLASGFGEHLCRESELANGYSDQKGGGDSWTRAGLINPRPGLTVFYILPHLGRRNGKSDKHDQE